MNGGWEDPQENDPGYQDNAIDRAVRQFVSQASGIPGNAVIPGNGPGPAPDTVFSTVLRMTDIQRGWPAEQDAEMGADYVMETRSDRNVLYQVQWYQGRGAARRQPCFRLDGNDSSRRLR